MPALCTIGKPPAPSQRAMIFMTQYTTILRRNSQYHPDLRSNKIRRHCTAPQDIADSIGSSTVEEVRGARREVEHRKAQVPGRPTHQRLRRHNCTCGCATCSTDSGRPLGIVVSIPGYESSRDQKHTLCARPTHRSLAALPRVRKRRISLAS